MTVCLCVGLHDGVCLCIGLHDGVCLCVGLHDCVCSQYGGDNSCLLTDARPLQCQKQ